MNYSFCLLIGHLINSDCVEGSPLFRFARGNFQTFLQKSKTDPGRPRTANSVQNRDRQTSESFFLKIRTERPRTAFFLKIPDGPDGGQNPDSWQNRDRIRTDRNHVWQVLVDIWTKLQKMTFFRKMTIKWSILTVGQIGRHHSTRN